MADRELFNHLRASLDRIPVIDTHEQMGKADYAASSGAEDMLRRLMPREMARLRRLKPESGDASAGRVHAKELRAILSNAQNTPQYHYVLATLADLFGCHAKEISEANWGFLSEKIVQRTREPGWPREVLKEKANIEAALTSHVSVASQIPQWAQGISVPLFRVDHFVLLSCSARGRRALERRYNAGLNSLNDLLGLIEKTVRTAAESGFAGLRTRLASFRTLHIENVTPDAVQGLFANGDKAMTAGETKSFQDFVFHAIVQCAIMHKLPIQIDAGIGGSGAATFARANPLHLTDLIFNYADARFAVLHGGFPFTGETAVLAKTFPNIYLDGTWIQHSSLATAKAVLHEWIEVVPCGKMMIWGGNSRSPEAAYASLLMAKDLVAEVLAEKVEARYFSEGLAVDIAWKLFRENAKSFYNLDRCRQILGHAA